MAETQMLNQLKFRITSLESQLHDKQNQLQQYQTIESEADNKIKALNKVHTDKVRNLLNSIQILKKEKASIEGLSKEHKRSKLIEQLNKQIGDQDLAIQVLRKYIYDQKGKQKGRDVCDQIIVKALTKGPERIRPLSREQLRMEIDRLKGINLSLEGKLKNRGNEGIGRGRNNIEADDISQVSTVSEQSFVNQNQNILRRMRDLQFQNQNTKLQINAKLKIIEQLKIQLRQKQKLKTDLQISKNETEVAQRKVLTMEKLMKQTKEHTNTKIIELYERQIKVEELQMVSNQNKDRLKQAHENHNILSEEMRLEKQQIQAELEAIKSQNEQLILQNIASKKRLDELKKIIKDMDQLNSKQKQDLKGKVSTFEKQLEKLIIDNKKYTEAYKDIESTLFKERAQWVDQKFKLIDELKHSRENAGSKQLISKYMDDIMELKQQNAKLKALLEGGGGGGDDHILLQRLQGYKRKLDFYEGKGDKNAERDYYNEIFNKYNSLSEEFEQYKKKYGPKKKFGDHRKHYIEVNHKQQSEYQHMSSGISKLGLEQVSSDILDNFDSSYQFEFVINQFGEKVKMPRLTDADKQLLKLITSDLWGFVTDNKMDKKIQQASYYMVDDDDNQQPVDYVKVRQIKNLTNPKAKKVVMYEQEINKLNNISDSVSITSALDKQLNKYDSDVNIQMKKIPKGTGTKNMANPHELDQISLSIDGLSSQISTVKSGQSNLNQKKKKKQDKGSRINMKKGSDKSISNIGDSQIQSSFLDSDVSSKGIRQSQLAGMDSDVQVNFRKKK